MVSEIALNQAYSLSFTAASLRPELARIVAETYLSLGDWDQARDKILATNALQARTKSSSKRMEGEMRQRLQTLTRDQLAILAYASADSRRTVAWLSVLKHSAFIFSFIADVLRSKIEAMDPVLRPSDYENYFVAQSAAHPEVGRLAQSSRAKIRQVTVKMLREVGILDEGNSKDFILKRPLVPHDVLNATLIDNPRWLAGFLMTDQEITSSAGSATNA